MIETAALYQINLPDEPVITLTADQENAFNKLLDFAEGRTAYGIMIMEGWAGTGKTFLLGRLVHSVSQRIALAAPTNKAVRVIMEKVQSDRPAYGSIHSFLGLQLKELEGGKQECKPVGTSSLHEYDLVIVDEASMIDMEMLQRILTARRTARVLFVGDPAQLPPINDKGVLSPVFDRIQNKAVLTEVVRQAAESPIIGLSVKIREAIEENRYITPEDIMQALPVPDDNGCDAGLCFGGFDTVVDIVVSEIQENIDARAIAYRNDRVIAYNRVIHATIHGDTEMPYVPGQKIIMQNAHDAKRSGGYRPVILHTSEECVIEDIYPDQNPKFDSVSSYHLILIRDSGERVRIYIPQNDAEFQAEISGLFAEYHRYKQDDYSRARKANNKAYALKNAFASIRHAYALTAHKSQGSTFETAVIDYPDLCRMKSTFEFNRALYVACTRASKHLAIVV